MWAAQLSSTKKKLQTFFLSSDLVISLESSSPRFPCLPNLLFSRESSGDMVVRLGLVKSASLTNVSVGGLGVWHDVGGVVFYLKFNQLVIIGLVGRKKFVKT